MAGFVLAHLSDPHLPPLPKPTLAELAGKRLLGFINWQRRRRLIHRADSLARIVADLRISTPDHIAVTGDLVNIALPQEFPAARAFLTTLGKPHDVTLVPGNHDAYVRATQELPRLHWGNYMRGDADEAVTFPALRRRGPLSLIGLSTAIPTAPFMATGEIGEAQRTRLADVLEQEGREGRFRVVLIHHPPHQRATWHKRLTDSAGARDVLARHGAELVLHGHDHIHETEYLDGPNGRVPIVGVPSASAVTGRSHDDGAAYNLFSIEGAANAWRCEFVSRGFRPGGSDVIELARRTLS